MHAPRRRQVARALQGLAGPLGRASALNLAARILAVLLGLALVWLVARLGPEAQGLLALFLALEGVLLAAGSGFGALMARHISHHGRHPGALTGATVLACVAIGTLVAALACLVSRTAGETRLAWWALALVAPLALWPGNLSGLWLGSGRMRGLSVLLVATPALALAGVGLSFWLTGGLGVQAVLLAWVVARGLVAVGSVAAVVRLRWWGRPQLGALVSQAPFIAIIGLTNLLSLLNYKVDLFLVQHFLGLSATGVYSVAVAVAELLWLASSAVTAAAYARLGQPDRAAAAALALKAMRASVAVLLLISPVLWLAAAFALPWALGEPYRAALWPLAVLLPGVALFGAASALSAWFTNHAGQPRVPAALAALSLLTNAAVSAFAIPRWGLLGGAVATTFSYALAMGVGAWLFARAAGVPMGAFWRAEAPSASKSGL
jgi:O-antigen/teichoic acid export membrane protein